MLTTDIAQCSLLAFDLPFMINLPDGKYVVNFQDMQASVILTRKKTGVAKGVPEGVVLPPDSYVTGDRWGRFQCTAVTIQIYHPIHIKVHVLLPDYILALSTTIINRILDVCRGVKGDHYIRINTRDIFSYDFQYVDMDGKVRPL